MASTTLWTVDVDGDNGYRASSSPDLVVGASGPVVFPPGRAPCLPRMSGAIPASGRFFLYYTANSAIGVAEAAGPLGPFTNPRKLFDSSNDAHLFCDGGRLYLYFVQLPGFRITVQEMAGPTEKKGQPRVVLQPESDWEIRNGRVTEGPWMIKHGGRYYLLYSGSGANTPDYAVGYATADDPLGPFTRADHNPILHRSEGLFGPGHGCAIRDRAGAWWFVLPPEGHGPPRNGIVSSRSIGCTSTKRQTDRQGHPRLAATRPLDHSRFPVNFCCMKTGTPNPSPGPKLQIGNAMKTNPDPPPGSQAPAWNANED